MRQVALEVLACVLIGAVLAVVLMAMVAVGAG